MLDLLEAVHRASGGALALVSGRSIAGLDALFEPLELPVAGLHGAERRDAAGRVYRRPRDPALGELSRDLREWCKAHPGTLLEDKQGSLALHYRLAPSEEQQVREVARAALARAGDGYVLARGQVRRRTASVRDQQGARHRGLHGRAAVRGPAPRLRR